MGAEWQRRSGLGCLTHSGHNSAIEFATFRGSFEGLQHRGDFLQLGDECRITLTNAQVRELYDNELVKWAQTKADDKDAKKPMHVEFDGETLTVGNVAFGYYKLQLASSKRAHVSLTMRPRDVLDLFKALIAHNVQQCTMSGDNNGMLELSWEDGVGIYSVYVPAVERGSLAKACLGHIKTTI